MMFSLPVLALGVGSANNVRPSSEDPGPQLGEAWQAFVHLGIHQIEDSSVIARAAPTANIVAVEPSSHLRAVLLPVVASDVDLRSRVTVENRTCPAARLPEFSDAVVIVNTLGHLDNDLV